MMMSRDPNRDPLTHVWNRDYALKRLEEMAANCAQIALILIDIDRLKSLNDGFGLERGDEKIVEIARGIGASSGENALVSRVGGDEFGVILPDTSLQTAREIAENIRANREPMPLTTYEGKAVMALSLSLGIAHFPTQVSSAENLLAAADLALLKAKDGGRLPDGTAYAGRNRVMAIGNFLDEFPQRSAQFLHQNESTSP